jgi:hypothetical protein
MPYNSAIHTVLRGQLCNFDVANQCMQATPAVAAAHALGIALSDGDPDTTDIAIAVKDYTVAVTPESGYVPATGDLLYPSLVTAGAVGKAVNGPVIGWVINGQLSAQGTIEMGTLYICQLTQGI